MPSAPLRRWAAVLPLLVAAAFLAPHADADAPLAGPDVSKYQHPDGKPIDWAAVKGAGQSFAFIKATGGSDRTDPWFSREWVAAGKAGLIRGAYHYADPSSSADAQAAYVVSVVGTTREASDLGIVLDLESSGGLSPAALSRWAHTFLDGVERRTGRVPILYTYPNFWHTKMKDDRTFGAYPLWLARYSDEAPAPLPGWTRWTFWQHTSHYALAGIPGRVDHDQMCCSAGTLTALADGRSISITRVWRGLGGASGQLGLPLGPEAVVPGGWGQTFEHGFVSTATQGTWPVLGEVYERYRLTGGAAGPLGLPLAPREQLAAGVVLQRFQGGVIVGTTGSAAHVLRGDLLARWRADGGALSPEGLPTEEAGDVAQQFVGGGLYRTPTGVHLVPGAIRDRYEQLGGPASLLGLPAGEPYPSAGGRAVDFQTGQLLELTVAGQPVVV